MKEMVTIPEAAEILKCSKQNVYQTIARHKIPTPKKCIKKKEIIERSLQVKQVDLNVLKAIIKAGDNES